MVNPPAADSQRAPCRTLSPVGIGGWLPPQLQTAREASLAPHPALRNAASGRFSDGGLVAEVGAAPHASAACTPYSSLLGASFKPDVAGRTCILSGRRVVQTQTMAEVARESEVWPSRALESATRALLRSQPSGSAPSFYIRTCCGAAGLRPPAAGWEAVATAPGASPRRGLLRPPIRPGCGPAPLARRPPFKYTLGPTLRLPEP